ncbi:hypothetical protein AMTRI_Chr12g272880 [Amborella trichopoda]
MNSTGIINGFSIEFLNQSNYKIWSTDALKKWSVTNAKAESILKRSISHNLLINLCLEISLLDPKEPISEAQIKWHIILGLKRECIPYVIPIQG